MVRAHAFPFWSGNFSAVAAHRSVLDVRRHVDRGAFLYGSRAHRTEVRYRASAPAGDVSGFSPTAGSGIFALLHLAPLQADAAWRYSRPRTSAGRCESSAWFAAP